MDSEFMKEQRITIEMQMTYLQLEQIALQHQKMIAYDYFAASPSPTSTCNVMMVEDRKECSRERKRCDIDDMHVRK